MKDDTSETTRAVTEIRRARAERDSMAEALRLRQEWAKRALDEPGADLRAALASIAYISARPLTDAERERGVRMIRARREDNE